MCCLHLNTYVNFVLFKKHTQQNAMQECKCSFKGRVDCFSMQVVINKCFLLNPEKKFGADLSCHLTTIQKKAHFNAENDVTEPKARRLGYSNNHIKSC